MVSFKQKFKLQFIATGGFWRVHRVHHSAKSELTGTSFFIDVTFSFYIDAGFKKPNAIVSKHACSSSTGYSSHGNGSIIATAFRDSVSVSEYTINVFS